MVKIKDSDAIRKADTSGGQVFSVQDVISSSNPLSKEKIKKMFPNVFNKVLGLLDSSQLNTLPGEVKTHFAVKSRKA